MSINQYNSQKPAFGRANSGGSFANAARSSQMSWSPQNYAPQTGPAGGNHGRAGLTPGRTVNGLRFVSGLVDTIAVTILVFLIIGLFVLIEISVFNGSKDLKIMGILLALAAVFFYGVFMEASKYQGTLGKLATNTIITDYNGERLSFGRSFGRNAGKLVSACLPLYFPYIMVCFTARNQSLHDMMAKTLVSKNLGDTQNSAQLDSIFA